MKSNIKNNISSILFTSLLLLSFSCSKDKKVEENTSTKTENAEHKEEEHEENIAALSQEQMDAVGITLGMVEQKELTAIIKANGLLTVPNNNKGNVTSLYGGVIKTLNVQIGSYVKKGQVIATIDNPQFIQLQEDYLTIQNRIIYAQQEVNRQKELNAGNAGALKNLQNASAELNVLRTRKASLQQQIRLMGIGTSGVSNGNLRSNLVVRSPLSGVVSNLFSKIGSYVDVSSPIAEVVDNSAIHLDLQIFEKDLPKLQIGQVIHFTLTNNPTTEYDAKVFSIGSSFANDSKTIAVHCKVTGDKTGLIDGMNITGIVSLNNVTTPAVPNDAIVSSEGKDYIFVLTDKKPEEHHDEGEEEGHGNEAPHKEETTPKNMRNFERIQVVKGVSNVGYTAVDFVQDIPENSKIATKGAFFINAKLSNTGGHEH